MTGSAVQAWLGETPQLDLSHPRLRITAQKLTQCLQTMPERAAAVQAFVRRLPLSAAPQPGTAPASRILERGHGDAHAKAVLFTALCRAAGLPARVQFLRVRAAVLAGILHSRPRAIVHAVAQVHVDGRWVSTDGYVVDPVLFVRARELLQDTDLDSGWGIVRDAPGLWDGKSACLHQFRWSDVLLSYGVFDDVQDFIGSGEAREWVGRGWLRRAVRSWRLNRRLVRVRRSAPVRGANATP
ncbi:MAG: transglutaminase-like domain-containing protein [Ramlibacter sp.]